MILEFIIGGTIFAIVAIIASNTTRPVRTPNQPLPKSSSENPVQPDDVSNYPNLTYHQYLFVNALIEIKNKWSNLSESIEHLPILDHHINKLIESENHIQIIRHSIPEREQYYIVKAYRDYANIVRNDEEGDGHLVVILFDEADTIIINSLVQLLNSSHIIRNQDEYTTKIVRKTLREVQLQEDENSELETCDITRTKDWIKSGTTFDDLKHYIKRLLIPMRI